MNQQWEGVLLIQKMAGRLILWLSMALLLSSCGLVTRAPTATDVPGAKVQVWMTLSDETKKLSPEPDQSFLNGPGTLAQTISIDPSILFQRFEGAGAAMTDSAASVIFNALPQNRRDELMRNLFTRKDSGIGINYIRIPMGATDFSLGNYTYDDMPSGTTDSGLAHFSISHDEDYIIPLLQQAAKLNPQLRFMASPWSSPAWMKDSGRLNGGTLNPAYYRAFSDYFVKFIQAYGAAGIP
ncbi:MAG: hypothetical protein WBM17_16635, partial [Anaerolineales bacterium]